MIEIITAFIAFSAVWVYFDATKNKIGKIPDEKGIFNMSAGAWAIVTLFLWIIAFPSYLIKRNSLLNKAKEKPVDVTERSGKLTALSLVAILWVVLSSGGILTEDIGGRVKALMQETVKASMQETVKASMQKTVKASMQKILSTDSKFKYHNLTVDSVHVFKNSEYSYKGLASIIYKGSSHNVTIEILVDGDNFMWEAKPGSFLFIAQDKLLGLFQ